jgi:hypothetical protein
MRPAVQTTILLALLLALAAAAAHAEGTLALDSTPSGASISLNDALQAETTPWNFTLAAGSYTVNLSLTGYEPNGGIVLIEDNATTPLMLTLQEIPPPPAENGSISITTSPSGATVFFNDTDMGVTSVNSGALSLTGIVPGTYALVVTLANHVEHSTTVDIVSGANTPLDITLIPLNATLALTSSPTNAAIRIDGALQSGTTPQELSLPPGTYTINVSLANYTANTTTRTLSANQTLPLNLVLSPINQSNPANDTNANLTLLSSPSGASIRLDGTANGITPKSFSLAPGVHTVNLTIAGYTPNATTLNLTSGQSLTITLNLALISNVSNSSNSTNTTNTTNSTQGNLTGAINLPLVSGRYHMWETDTARFSVSPASGTYTWAIDGVKQSGSAATFNWTPGIIYVGGETPKTPTVTVTNGASNYSWPLTVEYVVNAFFTPSRGSGSTLLEVYTNDNVVTFTQLNVSIVNGGRTSVFALQPNQFPPSTVWKDTLGSLPAGDNNLKTVTGFNNATNTSTSFTVPQTANQKRGYFNTKSTGGGGKSGGGGGGGGGGSATALPELVYVIFGKDAINISETQTVTLDAKHKFSVERAQVVLLLPNGKERSVDLSLVQGKASYGTWSANFSGFRPGLHKLVHVNLWYGAIQPMEFNITDRAFYAQSDTASAAQLTAGPLVLIYSVLNSSTVEPNASVRLQVDARDDAGLRKVVAVVKSTRGDSQTIALKLATGTALYGTWEGAIKLTEPDTTYSVTEIRLSNENDTKSYLIKDRSVYVNALPVIMPLPSLTGNVIANGPSPLRRLVEEPMVPVIVGFGLMLLLLAAIFINRRLKTRDADE